MLRTASVPLAGSSNPALFARHRCPRVSYHMQARTRAVAHVQQQQDYESQRQVIHRIRRKNNQEGQPRGPDAARDAKDNMRTIAGQAQLLSTELYSKPTHFLLELVQNADDCSYADGVEPELLLVLFDDALLYASNETGFEEANVRSICDMAKSTKSRRLGAFTGEKGIGFKATAVASECTYISSNGYQFSFDMRPGAYPVEALGLVCPRWEDNLAMDMEQWVKDRVACRLPNALLERFHNAGTRIWMQLKPECDVQGLTQQLGVLDPFMLLNLRKLRHMTVLDMTRPTPYQRSFARSAPPGNSHQLCISVTEGALGGDLTVTERHLVCLRKVVQVPASIASTENKRSGVDEVEFVFALPVTADGCAAPDPSAMLFAFLPVRPYGFRFPIQADFILPSNREGILEDRKWNQWLRTELAPAFVEQLMSAVLAHHQAHNPSAGLPSISSASLLQYIPLPGDVTDEFLSVAAVQMLQLLNDQPCLPGMSGQLRLPAQLLQLPELFNMPNRTPLISNHWLAAGLPGMEYTQGLSQVGDSSQNRNRAKAVLCQLGCRELDAALSLQWLSADGTQDLLRQLPVDQRTEWLRELYKCLCALAALCCAAHAQAA